MFCDRCIHLLKLKHRGGVVLFHCLLNPRTSSITLENLSDCNKIVFRREEL